jgi:predicted RNase H-like nuclease (RuvC/YqgF family)
MKLWVTGPARAATVPDFEEPQWAHFEKVHISLDVNRVLARKEQVPPAPMNQAEVPTLLPAAVPPEGRQGSASPEDLQLQIRELSGANQELRDRLDKQGRRMEQLQNQLEQLHRELQPPASKKKTDKAVPAQ